MAGFLFFLDRRMKGTRYLSVNYDVTVWIWIHFCEILINLKFPDPWYTINLNEVISKFNFPPTLRTVFFFGERSSTRFCDSIPDVFCINRTRREGVGYCYAPLALINSLWEPGQRCGQRWQKECYKHSKGRATFMISEACTHKHSCTHTHMEWKKPATKGIYLLLVCDVG